MVSIPHKSSAPSESTQSLLDTVSRNFAPAEGGVIRKACDLAGPLYEGQVELTGTPLLQHALNAAAILAGMNMDHETIAATILHAVPGHLVDWPARIENDFGSNIKMLVEGISRVEQIEQFSEMPDLQKKDKDEAAQQIERLRKMLLAMVQDIRVVLIKLAEQLVRRETASAEENRARDSQHICAACQPTRRMAAEMGTGRSFGALSGTGVV
jgi:GTP pyrophosphokinase